MTFVDTLMSFLSSALSFIGDAIATLLGFLAYPLGWIVAIIEGIWYFLAQLFFVLVSLIDIFVALFQFLAALGLGFIRTIKQLLIIDPSRTPVNFPSSSSTGIQTVIDHVLQPTGLLTVVPMIVLAFLYFFFVTRIIGLVGGDRDS